MFTFIVIALLVSIVAVVAIWCLSPAYRRRIEEPKYRFQRTVDQSEENQRAPDKQERNVSEHDSPPK